MTKNLAIGVLLAILAVLNVRSQQYYVDRSRGLTSATSATFVEFPGASQDHVLDKLATWRKSAPNEGAVVTDSYSRGINLIQSLYASGTPFYAPSAEIFDQIVGISESAYISPVDLSTGNALISEYRREQGRRTFRILQTGGEGNTDAFEFREMPKGPHATLFRSGAAISVLNRTFTGAAKDAVITPIALESVRNDLVFVSSDKGYSPQYFSQSPTALYGLEPNVYLPNTTQAALGRLVLLEILHPSDSVRIEFSASATQIPQNERKLGHPTVTGLSIASFGAEGRGAMHLISEPVRPQLIGGRAFVMLDTGVEARPFVRARHGLFGLYGRDVAIDSRKISVFARNISALDASAPERPAPSGVESFPADLANPNLLYSGVYEDGWVSERSSWVLSGRGDVVVDGVVPSITDPTFTTLAKVFVDGWQVTDQAIGVGDFHLRAPVDEVGNHRIELTFTSVQRLPGDDGRIVAALLRRIQIVSKQ